MEFQPIDYKIVSQDQLAESELSFACFRTQKDLDEVLNSKVPIRFRYILKGFQGACRQQFHKDLRAIGGQYVSPQKADPGVKYFYLRLNYEPNRDRKYWNQFQCLIKSMMKIDSVIKAISKPELPKLFPNMVPKTFTVKRGTRLPKGIWIAKPDGITSYSGAGISIVRTQSELDIWIQRCRQDRAITGMVISEYIQNPKLFGGRKFHYRVSILICSWKHVDIFPKALILTAYDEYQNNDFGNPAIHDTHMKSTADINTVNIADVPGMLEMLTEIAKKICAMDMDTYPDQKYGYKVFAPDILEDDTGKLHLLEINYSPSLALGAHWNETARIEYENLYHHWEFQAVKALI